MKVLYCLGNLIKVPKETTSLIFRLFSKVDDPLRGFLQVRNQLKKKSKKGYDGISFSLVEAVMNARCCLMHYFVPSLFFLNYCFLMVSALVNEFRLA